MDVQSTACAIEFAPKIFFGGRGRPSFEIDGISLRLDYLTRTLVNLDSNAPINVKPEGGTPGICGAFDLFCLPHPREFDLESGPQGGDVCFFFARRTGS